MSYTAEVIDNLKQAERFEMQISKEIGRINDLARDNVIIHVSKPIGSTTGWVGTFFWQVWVENGDNPGRVYARVNSETRMEWDLDKEMSIPDRLDAAAKRLVAEVQARRETELAQAKEALATLENAR